MFIPRKYVSFNFATSTNKCQNKQDLMFLSSSCENIMIMLTQLTCSDTYMIYGRRRKYCMLPWNYEYVYAICLCIVHLSILICNFVPIKIFDTMISKKSRRISLCMRVRLKNKAFHTSNRHYVLHIIILKYYQRMSGV